MKYKFKLTEEVVRWVFEVETKKNSSEYYIAFTNPTAGPWKKITFKNNDNIFKEVYRFESEEKRPDLVLVDDSNKKICIIEAKDYLNNLLKSNQPSKTVEVFEDMIHKFKNSQNKLLKSKSEYTMVFGLLWGCDSATSDEDLKNLFNEHIKLLDNYLMENRTLSVLGIEVIYNQSSNNFSIKYHNEEYTYCTT